MVFGFSGCDHDSQNQLHLIWGLLLLHRHSSPPRILDDLTRIEAQTLNRKAKKRVIMAGRARHMRDLPTHLHVSGFKDSANNNDTDNCEDQTCSSHGISPTLLFWFKKNHWHPLFGSRKPIVRLLLYIQYSLNYWETLCISQLR